MKTARMAIVSLVILLCGMLLIGCQNNGVQLTQEEINEQNNQIMEEAEEYLPESYRTP